MEPFVGRKTAHLWWMFSCTRTLLPLVGGKKRFCRKSLPRAICEWCPISRTWAFLDWRGQTAFLFCVSRRFVTCRSAWRRCSAGTSWHTIRTGPWRSASCAIRSSPATTTSKCTWRTCTGKRRARGGRALSLVVAEMALGSIYWPVDHSYCTYVARAKMCECTFLPSHYRPVTSISVQSLCLHLGFVLKQLKMELHKINEDLLFSTYTRTLFFSDPAKVFVFWTLWMAPHSLVEETGCLFWDTVWLWCWSYLIIEICFLLSVFSYQTGGLVLVMKDLVLPSCLMTSWYHRR